MDIVNREDGCDNRNKISGGSLMIPKLREVCDLS